MISFLVELVLTHVLRLHLQAEEDLLEFMVEDQFELSYDRVLVVCELLFRVELLDGLRQFLVILVLDLGNLFLHHLQL